MDAGEGPFVTADDTTTVCRLTPAVSKRTVINCGPAPSVTGTETVVQFCQPPVAGTATRAHTLLGPLNPR